MDFHKKYKKISPWWRFVRQEFELLYNCSRMVPIYNKQYEDYHVKLSKNGLLIIRDGFKFGASGPTIDTPSSREASCFHDALYYLSQKGVFKGDDSRRMREISDDLLYKICIHNGMWKWRAKAWLKTLEIFGGIAWKPEY